MFRGFLTGPVPGTGVVDVSWVLAGVAAAAILTAVALAYALARTRRRIRELASASRSQATRHGQITEQFVPFAANWPWDPKRFRFLGDPIDGIQFTDDGVILVEIKTGRSALSTTQRRIRDQVQAGRVAWHEVKLR